ncbi:MAG TPA: sugar ABC transporter ATP-binding protein [Spirochaetales bacterium]|nr:sugar ABC transporter ATP-binding protein [Spirochaetales bacterium]HRY54987.1 sugar ABC transporter ATP-binding protein [Spirochaetia bacterium]
MSDAVLRSERLCKRFGITTAVDDVSLEFEKGEIHGLIGENGSGKSTFCSTLCGIYPPSSGRFLLEGKELKARSQVEANRRGVSIIVQETGTLPGLTVAENLFLGEEDKFMHGIVKDAGAMDREAQRLLNEYGFTRIVASRMIDYYSFEDRKLIEIVKATYFNPKVLVVDETTTALSQSGREELFTVMDRARSLGNTVIFISHDLEEVIERADRISVLRDGRLVATVRSAEVGSGELKHLMVGRELGTHYYRTDYGEPVPDEVVLRVDDLSVPGQIQGLSFDLRKGEILGIGGLSECGMHEVGKAIFGASFGRSGRVTLEDGYGVDSIPGAIRHGVAYASKDRDNESVVIADSIRDNICLPSLDDLAAGPFLRSGKLDAFARRNAELMSVKMTGIDQYVSSLSGGNRQKVVLARWLGKDSDILVLDSPTRGIDVKVKADIYALMDELRRKGKSIVMISEELQELLGMSDRILIMKRGRISGEFARSRSLGERDLITKMV